MLWFFFQSYRRKKKVLNLKKELEVAQRASQDYEGERARNRSLQLSYQEERVQHQILIQENQVLREILEILPIPIWSRDPEKGVTYCNKSYASFLSSTPEAVMEQNEKLWKTPSGFNDYNLLPYSFNQHVIHKGDRRLLEFYERTNPKFQAIVGYALDQTETDKIKTDFDHHISAYREVLRTLSAGVLIVGPDTRVKSFNHAYVRMFKLDEKWLYTEPTLGELLDNLRERRLLMEHSDYITFKKQMLQLVTTLLSSSQELIHLPDGRTIRKIMAPHPMGGAFYIFEDLTDALTLEQRYNTQLAVQKASLDNLYEGVAVFGSDNRLQLCNPAFRKIWKLSQKNLGEELHLSDLVEETKKFFPDTNWAEFKSKLISRITDRVPKKRRIRRVDGSVLELSYVPLPDGSNLTSYIDITDRVASKKKTTTRKEMKRTA